MRLLPVLLLLPLTCFGQAPRGFFPWWDMPVARDLNLSDAQMQQIGSVTREFRNRMIDLRAAVEKAEGEFEDVMGEENVDQRRGNDVIERLVSARAELTRAFSQMNLRLRSVLTADQWKELQRRHPGRPGPAMRDRMLNGRPNDRRNPPPPNPPNAPNPPGPQD